MCNEMESGSTVNVRTGAHLVTGQQRVVCTVVLISSDANQKSQLSQHFHGWAVCCLLFSISAVSPHIIKNFQLLLAILQPRTSKSLPDNFYETHLVEIWSLSPRF